MTVTGALWKLTPPAEYVATRTCLPAFGTGMVQAKEPLLESLSCLSRTSLSPTSRRMATSGESATAWVTMPLSVTGRPRFVAVGNAVRLTEGAGTRLNT